MHRLAQHFKTRNVILFDDLPENVEAAIREGYRGKVVSQPGPAQQMNTKEYSTCREIRLPESALMQQ